ncbi:transcription initiation factor IIF, beta subunit-domain-containing protein [Syncephalis pseudoplumigaleata]|uniref:Transcription initiation factor IIF subunit beta n=1 Tax=Syncephalis pseudoplumigaleata TaxID=1712513 RepID=A0A4P9YSY1_9FUNG|nr:transcription initiation factor IIF, beta subunit-domain-containing protein [Syncephalis pseudoplumigaleata]|eukprot:RKP22798.1 transcription initiation factor IIF, beta subunit-domain-containing protein [Syncephalis pseudoplumigaleata]
MDPANDRESLLAASQESAFEDDEAFEFDLDMTRADTKVWLVKVPGFLAERWSDIGEENVDLGRIRINHAAGPNDRDGITLILDDTPEVQDLPTEYRLTVRDKAVKNTYVFEEDEDGEARAITGTVHHECSISVKNIADPRYFRLQQKRNHSQVVPVKRTQFLDDNARPVFIAPTHIATTDNDFLQRLAVVAIAIAMLIEDVQKKPRKSPTSKATRMPRENLITLLFSAFEKYQYWNLKGIMKYTNQPQAYLKEVLADICYLVKKGKYHSMYRLKEEYRKLTSSSDGTMNPEAQAGDNEVEDDMDGAATDQGSTSGGAHAIDDGDDADDDDEFEET